jgi:bifunctional non-homologous end joining protein LigD
MFDGLLTAAEVRRLQALGARPRALRTSDVEPMLATVGPPFSRRGWIFELKYDGFRMLAGRESSRIRLRYRSGTDVSALYPEIAAAVADLPGRDLVLDGELVVLDAEGRPDFQRLQARFMVRRVGDVPQAVRRHPAHFFAFDLLALDGLDLRAVPLHERKALLARLVRRRGRVRYVDHVETDGLRMHREVLRRGLEGMVAKRAEAPYVSGRASDWIKVPVRKTGAFVIVGFTEPGLGREGGLHVACAVRRRLVYAGRVGTGFAQGTLTAARELLGARPVPHPPCEGLVPRGRGHTWVEPRVVCEVRFLEQTDDGLLRHPVFIRFRPQGETSPRRRARVGRG